MKSCGISNMYQDLASCVSNGRASYSGMNCVVSMHTHTHSTATRTQQNKTRKWKIASPFATSHFSTPKFANLFIFSSLAFPPHHFD